MSTIRKGREGPLAAPCRYPQALWGTRQSPQTPRKGNMTILYNTGRLRSVPLHCLVTRVKRFSKSPYPHIAGISVVFSRQDHPTQRLLCDQRRVTRHMRCTARAVCPPKHLLFLSLDIHWYLSPFLCLTLLSPLLSHPSCPPRAEGAQGRTASHFYAPFPPANLGQITSGLSFGAKDTY